MNKRDPREVKEEIRLVHRNPEIFETTHFFYPDSCGWVLERLWRMFSKQWGSGDQIHWFRLGRSGQFV